MLSLYRLRLRLTTPTRRPTIAGRRLYWTGLYWNGDGGPPRSRPADLDVAAVQAALQADGARRLAALRLPRHQPDRRRRHRRRAPGRPSGDAALVLPDSGRTASRAGWSTPSNRTRSPTSPARPTATPAASSSKPGCGGCCRACKRVAMEYSPGCAIPYVSRVDAGTIELIRAARRRGRVVGRPGPAIRGRLARRGDRDAPGRVREAVPHQGSRVRGHRAPDCATASPTTEYDIQQLMADWFARKGSSATPIRTCRPPENAGNPHYLPTADRVTARFDATNWCCSICGASSIGPARCLPTSPGWDTPAATCPSATRAAFAAVAAARDAGDRAGAERASRAGRELRGWEVDRAASAVLREAGLRRPDPASHRPQPRRNGARQRREHGRLRDPRRSPAAPGHRLHDRARRLLRRLRRPLGNQYDRRARATRA